MEKSQETRLGEHPTRARLVRKMRPGSPIRQWLAFRKEGSAAGSAQALLSILERPRGLRPVDLAVAYYALAEIELSPAERGKAERLLVTALTSPPTANPLFRAMVAAFLSGSIFAAYVTSFYDMFALFEFAIFALTLTVVLTPFWFAGFGLLDGWQRTLFQRAAATALAGTGSPECIVALDYHLCYGIRIRREVRETLRAVLPTVDSSWYGRLPYGCQRALTELATSSEYETDLVLAALDALGQAGDGEAVRPIERIVQDRGVSARIRERAAAVLLILIARREQETQSSTLLRPSAAAGSDHLVRPAYGATPDVANLLRASPTDSPDAP